MALQGAAERRRHAGDHRHRVPGLVAQLAHAGERLHHVLRGATHVRLTVGRTDGHRHHDAMSTRGKRVLSAAQVRRQHSDRKVRERQGMGHHFSGIGHLRQQLRRNERRDLHVPHTRLVGRVDPFSLRYGGHDAAKALQPVAHTDFVQHQGVHAATRKEELPPA